MHAGAAAIGISALLIASATAFTVLKVVGVVYLLWLAVNMLAAGQRRQSAVEEPPATAISGWSYLRQGFLSNALNPKVALFFVTFLPKFLSSGSDSPRSQALLFSAVFGLIYVAWFGLYVAAVERLGRWLRNPKVSARIEQITGVCLLALAARLAVASH